MQIQKGSWFPVLIGMAVLILVTVPFIYAWSVGGAEYVFGGFLLNPLDGNTYLAKMYQGWEGNWRNQMAFSADPGEGAYINLYYLFLGHLARIVDLPLIIVYHCARLLGTALMLGMLWRFYRTLLPARRTQRLAYALAALGSGMGWIMIPFGQITSDLWVGEIYPFLSAFTNPHFPLGLTLALWLILPRENSLRGWRVVSQILLSLLISLVSPFGLVIVLTVLVGRFIYLFFAQRAWSNLQILRDEFLGLLLVLIGGAPLMLYYVWIATYDPVIAIWNAQNLTLSPPLWDLAVSLSPALIFAIVGIWALMKRGPGRPDRHGEIMVIWMVLGLILVYIPFSLQRRFLTGLFVPLAGLAAIGIEHLSASRPKSFHLWVVGVFVLVIPTNLVVVLSGFYGARTHDANLYLSKEEARALEWITEHSPADTLVLASPDMGIFIPAHTSRRVIYGHPYETIYADQEKAFVERLYAGDYSPDEQLKILVARGVDTILCGPREQAISPACANWEFEVEFSDEQVLLLAVER